MNQSVRVIRASIFFCLTIAVLAVYARTFGYGYIVYDDTEYVYQNPVVRHGFSAMGLGWAWTTFWCANWHPLTWISLMLDCQFFGLNAGEQHAVNVFFHLASSLLLFLALWRMTSRPWRSAVVAGVFALHPLHVESVAWIAERKDVLSTFFEMAAMSFYALYVERPSRKRYALVAVAFVCALLSKPMVVTFPLLLLLIDFWPLKRLAWPPAPGALAKLLHEKLPLLALSIPACVVTFLAQRQGAAVVAVARYPIWMRVENIAIAYVRYLGKVFWPVNMAVLYPLEKPDWRNVAGSLALLVLVTTLVIRSAGKRSYLLAGWLWFLGTLVPVIGLVQVGVQAIADRYMYLPVVGIAFAVIWLVSDVTAGNAVYRRSSVAAAVLALALLSIIAFRQVGYWSSSKNLFAQALSVTGHNFIIENNMGIALAHENDYRGALRMYRLALQENPAWPEALTNLGAVLTAMGRPRDALKPFERALQLKPDLAPAHASLGSALCALERFGEARGHLEAALRLGTFDVTSESNLCLALHRLGQLDEAAAHCHRALRWDPAYEDAHINLGSILAAQGRRDEAAGEFRRALAANPKNAAALAALDQLR